VADEVADKEADVDVEDVSGVWVVVPVAEGPDGVGADSEPGALRRFLLPSSMNVKADSQNPASQRSPHDRHQIPQVQLDSVPAQSSTQSTRAALTKERHARRVDRLEHILVIREILRRVQRLVQPILHRPILGRNVLVRPFQAHHRRRVDPRHDGCHRREIVQVAQFLP